MTNASRNDSRAAYTACLSSLQTGKKHFFCKKKMTSKKISFLLHFAWILSEVDFCNFRNACLRKCVGHFLRNSTQLRYTRVLQTGRVSASVLIRTPLVMACKHGKIEICIMGDLDFLHFVDVRDIYVCQ